MVAQSGGLPYAWYIRRGLQVAFRRVAPPRRGGYPRRVAPRRGGYLPYALPPSVLGTVSWVHYLFRQSVCV